MDLGPKLVIRGVFLGIIVLVIFAATLTAGASAPLPTDGSTENDDNNINQNELLSTSIGKSDHCLINSNYPEKILRWCELITIYAEIHDLPPNLIASIIWQESGGKPTAYSKSGAVGLMQIMPSDGIAASFMCVNGPCFTNRPTISELEDPEFNIKYGTKMLARLNTKHGNMRDALKAYGPMDVGYYYADKVLSIYNNHID
jgi:hypothetical protein